MLRHWTGARGADPSRVAFTITIRVGKSEYFTLSTAKSLKRGGSKEAVSSATGSVQGSCCCRAVIRAKRKSKEPIGEELSFLYWLAALRSFMLDYAPILQEPGFNVFEAMPGRRLGSLQFSYAELGYRELTLLNKTDVKWLVSEWGEPSSHTTMNTLYRDLWDRYERALAE